MCKPGTVLDRGVGVAVEVAVAEMNRVLSIFREPVETINREGSHRLIKPENIFEVDQRTEAPSGRDLGIQIDDTADQWYGETVAEIPVLLGLLLVTGKRNRSLEGQEKDSAQHRANYRSSHRSPVQIHSP